LEQQKMQPYICHSLRHALVSRLAHELMRRVRVGSNSYAMFVQSCENRAHVCIAGGGALLEHFQPREPARRLLQHLQQSTIVCFATVTGALSLLFPCRAVEGARSLTNTSLLAHTGKSIVGERARVLL